MRDNAEYCTGQDFHCVLTVYPPTIHEGGFHIWQCAACAYAFSRSPISDCMPVLPAYHPKPIPVRFTVSEEQKVRLKATLVASFADAERDIPTTESNGNAHRKEIKKIGASFYGWLKKNHYPEGFRILCHNCNSSYGHYGYCPHQRQ